jgi:hypothetical protein
MEGGVLSWLGLAGALAFIASASRRRAPAARDSSRCAWHVPDPVPPNVVQRALQLLARGDPLGTEYVEEVDRRIYKFRRSMHPPSPTNRQWHPGIDAQECVLPAAGSRSTCGTCRANE